jgi:ketosteroid isomerase-like protein
MIRTMLALFVVSMLLAGCTPEGLSEEDKRRIDSASRAWEEDFNSGDAAGVASHYAEDAEIYPPGMQPISGREAIEAFWQAFIDTGVTARLSLEETEYGTRIGYKVGTYAVRAPDGSTVDEGHFVEVFRPVGPVWLIYRDMWNSDLPPPEGISETSGVSQVR